MTTLMLLLVAAGLVALAVEVMVRQDRASRLATPGGSLPRRRGRHGTVRSQPASPALFILSAVLVLLVIATLV